MRRYLMILGCITLMTMVAAGESLATLYRGAIDLTSLTPGTEFELEFQLLGSGDVFDAEVLIDNILITTDPLGNMLIDFTDGNTLGGFMEDSYNVSDTVSVVSRSLNGTVSNVLRLMEDPDG